MEKLMLLVCALVLGGCATAPGARALRIDGSSASSFERSVALLQNTLPLRRREELEVSLGAIWMRNTTAMPADANSDGLVTFHDAQAITQAFEPEADDLLAAIRRGDVISAIQRREKPDGAYTATDYLGQLHGLTYDDVVSLADPDGAAAAAFHAVNERKFRNVYCWRQDHPHWSSSRITQRCAR